MRRTKVGVAFVATLGLVFSLVSPSLFDGPSAEAATGYDEATATSVIDLNVNGLYGDQLGMDDTTPTFAWRLDSVDLPGNPCFDDFATGTCGINTQLAYEIEAARSAADFATGTLVWDTGKVNSDETSATYAGTVLTSRDSLYWRVRIWDAN